MRPRLHVLAVPVRGGLRLLRDPAEDPALKAMEARALVESLRGERPRFVGLVRSRVATAADAEDVVQRAMLLAAEKASSLRDPARARAWFYRILRRAIVDHRRSVRTLPGQATPQDLEGMPDESVGVSASAPCQCAVHLLAELRPTQEAVVRRVDFEGKDAAAVASELGITADNLYVRLHRGRRALREKVERHCRVSSAGPCANCTCSAHERCGS